MPCHACPDCRTVHLYNDSACSSSPRFAPHDFRPTSHLNPLYDEGPVVDDFDQGGGSWVQAQLGAKHQTNRSSESSERGRKLPQRPDRTPPLLLPFHLFLISRRALRSQHASPVELRWARAEDERDVAFTRPSAHLVPLRRRIPLLLRLVSSKARLLPTPIHQDSPA